MADRTTWKQLDHLAEMVNGALDSAGSRARVRVERRYDYTALDLTCVEYLELGNGAAIKTLRIGTTGQLADYLRAMLEGLWLPRDYPAGNTGDLEHARTGNTL